MQHIVTGYDVVGDDATLGHTAIGVPGTHLQRIGNAAHTKDDKAENLVIHLYTQSLAAKLHIMDINSKKNSKYDSITLFCTNISVFKKKVLTLPTNSFTNHLKDTTTVRMRKNFLSMAVIVAAFAFALPSQAQVKLGVKAGLNVNSVSLKNVPDNIDEKNRNGFFAGLTADVTVPLVGLGADVSLLYDNRCVGLTDEGERYNKTLHYISLPINAKYTIGFSSLASVYLATGPQFSWNVGDRNWKDWGDTNGWALKKSLFSWNVGLGATVLKHFRVGYNYNIGLGNTGEGFSEIAGKAVKGKLKNNVHQISLTYLL